MATFAECLNEAMQNLPQDAPGKADLQQSFSELHAKIDPLFTGREVEAHTIETRLLELAELVANKLNVAKGPNV